MTPIIIIFNPNNLNSLGDSPQKEIDKLSGKHICHFHYSEPQKNSKFKRVRIIVDGTDWNIIVEIGKNQLNFCNPWFRKSRTMSAVNEDDGITRECNIIFASYRHDPTILIIERNLSPQLPEIREFVTRCSNIQKPIVPVHKEKEKDIWFAYCDGLFALNKERRDFISIKHVGSPILYNDTRQGEIYTLKIDIAKEDITHVKDHLNTLLGDKYQIGAIDIPEEKDKITIQFKGTEKINEDDLEQLNAYLQSFGFGLTPQRVSNVLKVSIAIKDIKERIDLFDRLDEVLVSKGLNFSNNEKFEYQLDCDSDVEVFTNSVSDVFGGLAKTVTLNIFKVYVEYDNKEQYEEIKGIFNDDSLVSFYPEGLRIHAENETIYKEVKNRVDIILAQYGLSYDIPPYNPVCKVIADTKAIIRNSMMHKAVEGIGELRSLASNIEFDPDTARVIRLTFPFKTAHEREQITEEIKISVNSLGKGYKLVIKKPLGITVMTYQKDDVLLDRLNEEMKYQFLGEEIKLVDGKTYTELFKGIKDPENIIDPTIRERYNRFMAECPIIGTCHKRTNDSIIVNLAESFYNGEHLTSPIREKDMIYFPSIGTSTDLRRQYDAIQRINKPGVKLSNGRKIVPPVNPGLCDFLFSPLYAKDIKADIANMMDIVRTNKIEAQLNEKQIEAVAKSVLAEDIAFIQGPPGTGKTTVIAEIIWQEISRNPKCRILLTSQTNLAVDNALERLKYKKSIRPLRVISDSRSSSDDLIYNANILDEWMAQPNDKNSENVVNKWIDNIIERIDNETDYQDVTKEWRDYLAGKSKSVRRVFTEEYKSSVNLIAATCSLCGSQQFLQAFNKMYECDEVAFDVVIMDEASKATPLEMAIPMVLGRKIIVIGDHKQLPPLLDENSIDTALHKIGRNDLAERIQDLKESQFKKLFQMAQKYKPNLVTTLDTQYRMHRKIMHTINQFYVDELGENGLICGIENVQDTPDYSVRGSRWHGITKEPFINPSTHAIWVNVEGNEEKERTSFKNMKEVNAVKLVIDALSHASGFSDYINSQKKIEDQEIGLITFYSAQKRELKKLEQNGELNRSYDYRIDVVDRFQGMERNIVIVSTVRSNKYNGIGFAKEIERINVAFSRARSLLIVIGNRDLFYTKYNYKKSIDAMEAIDIKQIEDLIKNDGEV